MLVTLQIFVLLKLFCSQLKICKRALSILHSLHPQVNYDIILDLHHVTCGAPPIDRQTADFQNRNDLSTRGTTDISLTESVAQSLEFSRTG